MGKEQLRDNQRDIRKAIRELDKQISIMQNAEKQLTVEIKKNAKANQMGSVRVQAQDLVRQRRYVTRFIEMKTQLNAVSLKLQTVKSTEAMVSAMKGVTNALTMMNKQVPLPGIQKVMNQFVRENERSDMTQDMIGDTLDDAMADDASEDEVDAIVIAVL